MTRARRKKAREWMLTIGPGGLICPEDSSVTPCLCGRSFRCGDMSHRETVRVREVLPPKRRGGIKKLEEKK